MLVKKHSKEFEELRYTAARKVWRLEGLTKPKNFPSWRVWWQDLYGNGETCDELERELDEAREIAEKFVLPQNLPWESAATEEGE